ncbi:MAG: nicotinate phosphoribosyltransferase, partial [Candidatus Eisenbacteria bacterium]|nr:nicotinate phosphoribosyltransferase [Candidatus Latescibacterota bacterium]MBD3300934.1 nicotinate phosphoribosyltransferase [Candidatus Eisenbacteria bacterium]
MARARLSPLFTDLYELTMMQGYRLSGLRDRWAIFDLFFRTLPYEGGYAIAAGLDDAVRFLLDLRFEEEDLDYLRGLRMFRDAFLEGLRGFRFTGDVDAIPEGTPVFPLLPLVRVRAPLDEAQLVESGLLNLVNYQTLIATKAARVCLEAREQAVVEYGLRRAHGPAGALLATRAAYVGGCAGTSNVEAGRRYGIPVSGTMAHSWVTAFPDEATAFRRFLEIYGEDGVLLVDTYDTLESGLPHAIELAKERRRAGGGLKGIRIDSGDLAYLSTEARRRLDEAGLPDVKIFASSDIDEWIIHDLKSQGAAIDAWGVGTSISSGKGDSALNGVYKLAAVRGPGGDWVPKRKLSDAPGKSTLPGEKQVFRLFDREGTMMADLVEIGEDPPAPGEPVVGHHPALRGVSKRYEGVDRVEPLLRPVLRGGKPVTESPSLDAIRERRREGLEALHPTSRRLLNPHRYKVSLGPRLQ